jgi:phytoene synthase
VARVAVAGAVSRSVGAQVTRRSGTSFYYAFRVLPAEKRRAIYALYAFCRAVDDCVDEEDGEGGPGLDRWLAEVKRAYAGTPETELGRELAETVARFPIPRASFEDVVAGCRMDLTTRRYATFADLRVYCERVASAVGLATIEVFGYDDPRTREYAVELGLALQLTNILRDIGPDAARDRLYLPLEDLAAFSVTEDEVFRAANAAPRSHVPQAEKPRPDGPQSRGPQPETPHRQVPDLDTPDLDTPRLDTPHPHGPRRDASHPHGPHPDGLQRLLAFEADRARSHYSAAARALPERDRRSMLSAEIMGAIYRDLLERWARLGHPVGPERVRLGKPRKLLVALRTIPRVYWGR